MMRTVILFAALPCLLFSAWLKANPLLDEDFIKTATVAVADIEQAISSGADVNATEEYGYTALMGAAKYNNSPAVITTLIEHGADVNIQYLNGETALMWAARFNKNPAVIIALLDMGADPQLRDAAGKTAFDHIENNAALRGSASAAYQRLKEAEGTKP